MAFKINEFRSSFVPSGEPASPTNYEVTIIRKPILGFLSPQEDSIENTSVPFRRLNDDGSFGGEIRKVENLLSFRCISCSLPGRILNTTDRSTYGPNRKIVTSTLFQDVTFSFIVSDDKRELNYFDTWHNFIVDNALLFGVQTHDVRYYDDYVGSIRIAHFDKQNEIKYTISLLEAYPISVEEIPLSWDNTNEFIRINVTVAYRNWIKEI